MTTLAPPSPTRPAPPPPRVVTITTAQRLVLDELCRTGAPNTTIAATLGITTDTVKSHLSAILYAGRWSNRTQVAVDCLRGRVRIRVRPTMPGPTTVAVESE